MAQKYLDDVAKSRNTPDLIDASSQSSKQIVNLLYTYLNTELMILSEYAMIAITQILRKIYSDNGHRCLLKIEKRTNKIEFGSSI